MKLYLSKEKDEQINNVFNSIGSIRDVDWYRIKPEELRELTIEAVHNLNTLQRIYDKGDKSVA